MCKGRSVWTEIKDFIEFDLRGKFRGGEYIIKVTTTEGITFDNREFFMNKDTFNKLGYKAKINTHTTSYIN